MVSLLVTGGSGFLRDRFINHVFPLPTVAKLVNLDIYSFENVDASIREDPSYYAVKGKLRDGDLLRYLLKEHAITHVVYFADYDPCVLSNPLSFTTDAVLGAQLLMETCHVIGADIPYLYVSAKTTDAVLHATNEAAELLLQAYAERYRIAMRVRRVSDADDVVGDFLECV